MEQTSTARAPALLGQAEIDWDKLDKTRFYVLGAGLFTGITTALYPMSVVKTRLQVAAHDVAEKNSFTVVKSILKTDGIPGLYRGLGTVVTGAIPARIIYITTLESTKVATLRAVEPFQLSETSQAAVANGLAGTVASLCAEAVYVPIDVVSQKQMVQGYSGHTRYNGGVDVARKVVKTDGIIGLYRGFGISVMTYVPSGAVWWATYGSTQRLLLRLIDSGTAEKEESQETQSVWKIVSVQGASGIAAGAAASCITTPIDTIKTRLQVVAGQGKKMGTVQVVKELISEEGWTGLYRGLGPRFFSMSAWGTSMILGYEYLKRMCAKED